MSEKKVEYFPCHRASCKFGGVTSSGNSCKAPFGTVPPIKDRWKHSLKYLAWRPSVRKILVRSFSFFFFVKRVPVFVSLTLSTVTCQGTSVHSAADGCFTAAVRQSQCPRGPCLLSFLSLPTEEAARMTL